MAIPKPKLYVQKGSFMPPGIPNIFTAAENNDVEGLVKSFEYYSVNERDENDMTPLHYAASTLSMDAIDCLLAHPDIDPTLTDKFGRTAVTVAVECWESMSDEVVDKLNPYCYPWLYSAPENSM